MPLVLLCIVWLSWGVSYPVTAIALAGFDVMTLRVAAQFSARPFCSCRPPPPAAVS